MLLMPFLAFGVIFLLMTGRYEYQPTPAHLKDGVKSPPMTFSPPVPSGTNLHFASITPLELAEAVNQMAAAAVQPAPVSAWINVGRKEVDVSPAPLDVPSFESRVFAAGLLSPDGIAIDPRTGNIFVSEDEANRIVMLTPKGQRRVIVDEATRLETVEGRYRRRLAPLLSPEGLAMDNDGTLYVVEDRPGGRVLALRVEKSGRVDRADEVQLPGNWSRFAWESIAIRDTGELLLAGSSAEAELGLLGGIHQGVIVYRDVDGGWWAPSLKPAASYSAVAFSKSGQYGVYADEISGTVGWIDLQSRDLREGASQHSFKTPEGIEIMPDGRVVVVEEGGRLLVLNPATDQAVVIAEGLGAVESACWDARRSRLLVSSDGKGAILELTSDVPWPALGDNMVYAKCQAEGALHHIPKRAPEFLRPILSLGGLQDNEPDLDRAFHALTQRMPILAGDSSAVPLQGSDTILDPVAHIQFVAFDPNRIRFDDPGGDLPVSVLILRTRSGQIYKTSLVRTVVLTGNMYEGRFENHGVFELPIPFAFQARVGPQGHAVIHFTGLGRAPDVAVAINPQSPVDSYMIVTHLDGTMEQYRLQPAPDGTTDNWVVSLPPNRPLPWLSIQPPADAAPAEAALPTKI